MAKKRKRASKRTARRHRQEERQEAIDKAEAAVRIEAARLEKIRLRDEAKVIHDAAVLRRLAKEKARAERGLAITERDRKPVFYQQPAPVAPVTPPPPVVEQWPMPEPPPVDPEPATETVRTVLPQYTVSVDPVTGHITREYVPSVPAPVVDPRVTTAPPRAVWKPGCGRPFTVADAKAAHPPEIVVHGQRLVGGNFNGTPYGTNGAGEPKEATTYFTGNLRDL